jgi:hypothetical protein
LEKEKSLAPARIQTLDHPVCSLVTIWTVKFIQAMENRSHTVLYRILSNQGFGVGVVESESEGVLGGVGV